MRGRHALFLLIGMAVATKAAAFTFDDCVRRAQQLASASYKTPDSPPKALAQLTYDQYRDIRYRPGKKLWADAGLPFEIAFYHVGFHFDHYAVG